MELRENMNRSAAEMRRDLSACWRDLSLSKGPHPAQEKKKESEGQEGGVCCFGGPLLQREREREDCPSRIGISSALACGVCQKQRGQFPYPNSRALSDPEVGV